MSTQLTFDPGYVRDPYRALVDDFPGADAYPPTAFRTEWGPVFHRGRLDGSARIMVVGQDPATHEAVCRRVLVGEAGQRVQGFLKRLGITRSYVAVNTFLYSVYGQAAGQRHAKDAPIVAYRHRWFDALAADNDLQVILSFGTLADRAVRAWRATPAGVACTAVHVAALHPTYPDSASRSGAITKVAAFERLCASWNTALELAHPVMTPDAATPLVRYGTSLEGDDLAEIPTYDLPPGLPPWMRSLEDWARRTGADRSTKRATITVTVPESWRGWPQD
jgi:Uracil DNA glycosylase superfamily